MKILLVEDEEGLVITLSDRLRSEGFEVAAARDGLEGLRLAEKGGWDLIILDVMLPGKNGLDVCRDLRTRSDKTPILMLTAKGETIDKVLGLKLGADDYLTKPFEILELLARIEALLRRSGSRRRGANRKGSFAFGNVLVDLRKAEVLKGGAPVELSAMEFKLLQFFIEKEYEVHSRDDLLDAVWGYDAMPTTRTVDVHVAWLRQKLEDNPKRPSHIRTVHGLGYKFVPEERV